MQTGSSFNGRELFVKLIPTLFMIALAIYVGVTRARALNIEDASYETRQALSEAFQEEVKEYASYITYQKVAQEEGYPEAARYFEAMAASDNAQSAALYQVLLKADESYPYPDSVDIDEVGTTEENLKKSYEHEYYMSREYYPELSYPVAEEGISDVYNAMVKCFRADTHQAALYEEVGDGLMGRVVGTDYYVCENCGVVTMKAPILRCGNCSVFRWKIKKY